MAEIIIESEKGLAKNRVGLIGAVIIGISCIAPTYTLTSGLGPTISAVGKYVPSILLLGFIPMLLVAFAYRELNNRVPDSGTSFTWATKAFGPWVGWMGGWGAHHSNDSGSFQPSRRSGGLLLSLASSDTGQPRDW